MLIIEGPEGPPTPSKFNTPKLSEDFGRNLDTVEKARQWLTNPHNWHDGQIIVVKWTGLLCTLSKDRGLRLFKETWDNGLPEVIVREQIRLRKGGKQEDVEPIQKEEA